MKYILLFLISFLSIILLSCDSIDNSILSSEQSSSKIFVSDPLINHTDQILRITKEIDGALGGQILLDTIIADSDGNPVSINASLTFEANSFTGIQSITIFPDVETATIKFLPAMVFDVPANLSLDFTGINLKKLGFRENSKVDFVFMSDDGGIQYLLKDECSIKWNKQQIYVKKAKLPHFSRYGWVR